MPTLDRRTSQLLVVDFQSRLMPAIDGGEEAVRNAGRLLQAAAIFDVPVLLTEQNPKGLGPTVQALAGGGGPAFHKMSFDACRTEGFMGRLADRPLVVVAGCEAHVCVLQTVLGLLRAGMTVAVVEDAVGARRADSKASAVARMARHRAEIVTTEMVVFEWLESAEFLRFNEVVALIK